MAKKVAFIELMSDNNMFKFFKLPNIGIIYLATILKNKGYETKVFSEQYLPIFNSKTKKIYKSILDYDIIGFNIITASAKKTYEMIKVIKKQKPSIKILVGGAHVTFMPEEAIKHCDKVIKGEAEEIITKVVEGKLKGKIIQGTPIKNLDKLPFPDFGLVENMSRYSGLYPLPISTSRGCPFGCSFCSVTKMFGGKYRFRSVDSLFNEIKQRYDEGFKSFFFYDDNFAVNKQRIKEFLKKLLASKIKIKWSGQARTDIAKDKELMELMKKTGCGFVLIGFESINEESLASINKKQNFKDIKNCIKVFNDNYISIHGSFILGCEGDSKETFKKTLKFCEKNNIYSVQFTTLTPLPGSELYSRLDKEGKIFTKDWSLYDTTHVVADLGIMPPSKLQKELMKIWKRFYSFRNGIKYEMNRILKYKNKINIISTLKRFGLIILLKLTLLSYIRKNKKYYRFLKNREKTQIK